MDSNTQFAGIVDNMIASLQGSSDFADIRILPQFTALPKEYPLKQISVAVGIEKAECYSIGFGDYLGDFGEDFGGLTGKMADITLSIGIYSPLNEDGSNCFTVFSDLTEHLMQAFHLRFDRISCSSIRYVRDVAAYFMPCTATFSVIVGISDEKELFTDITVRRTEE